MSNTLCYISNFVCYIVVMTCLIADNAYGIGITIMWKGSVIKCYVGNNIRTVISLDAATIVKLSEEFS